MGKSLAILLHGSLPDWTLVFSGDGGGYGDGDGDGDGGGYGYGDGDGYGDGSGYGYGYGGGYGDGYGYGYGDGYGDGDGDGYGGGYGYGYGGGYGDGSGDGSGGGGGDGSGSGYGDGDGYWKYIVNQTVKNWSQAIKQRFEQLADSRAFLAFWKSDKNGKPANGGSGEGAASGLVQEVPGPLALCGSHALHATLKPEKWKGERLWIVALIGEVIIQDDRAGALKREIIGEVESFRRIGEA